MPGKSERIFSRISIKSRSGLQWEHSAITVFQDVVLTFNARQFGRFQVRQKIDVVGRVASSSEDITELEVCSFHNISLSLSAICHGELTHQIHQLSPAEFQEENVLPFYHKDQVT